MKLRQLLTRLGRKVPASLSEPWDFPGYQCGHKRMDQEIRSVLLCLDYTEKVHTFANKEQPDLILTHHPFFFGKRKDVLLDDPLKAELVKRIEEELNAPIYSYHTDFDKAPAGMNDTLMSYLKMTDIAVASDGLLRTGTLPQPMSLIELCHYLCSCFSLSYLLYCGEEKGKFTKIGLIAGGAADEYPLAFASGVDCYLSGDCSHHTRLELKRYGYRFIELPHECEEVGFLLGMKKMLLSIDSLNVRTFAFEKPFEVVLHG